VPSFSASKHLITNGQFLEFVQAGAYNQKGFWSKEGWAWREYRKANHPAFWVCDQGKNRFLK